jgi:hypothetical protein
MQVQNMENPWDVSGLACIAKYPCGVQNQGEIS